MRLQLFREVFAMALDSVRSHKLRSFLTVLGIVIGVMTVIGMVSVISGLNRSFLSELESAGSDLILIRKFSPVQMGERSAAERTRKDITYDDAMAIPAEAKGVKAVAVSINANVFATLEVKYRNQKSDSSIIIGANEDWPRVFALYAPTLGRHITQAEVQHRSRVVALGSELADILFPSTNPLGKEIRIGTETFTVIGVLQKRGQMFGQSRDNIAVMPITTLMKYYPYDRENMEIAAVPKTPGTVLETMEEIRGVLRTRRNVPANKPDDFEIMTQDSLVDLFKSITGAAFLVMIAVSSIGLLVGGIGVMNIMLVSVKERTREIGIRKALGARSGDILRQFLLEAVVLTGIGGLLGLLAGSGIALVVKAATPLPAAISLWSVFVGIGVSTGIGLFFGIFPARKAARMDPIISLRYE